MAAQERCRVPPELRIPIRELVSLKAELERMDRRMEAPPCVECGAKTVEEASTMCHCSGDKDDCHGCRLWPDDEPAQPGDSGREG